MGISSMVIGIISAILGFIPLCNYFAFIPAVVGLILGIVDLIKKGKKGEPRGIAIAGVVLCSLAIVLIFVWTGIIAAAGASTSV
jgi:hypothetical protein